MFSSACEKPVCGLILLVRSGSSRLPKKSLIKISDEPIVFHQIVRLKQTSSNLPFILATTQKMEDVVLCTIADRCGIKSFQGHTDDVIIRLIQVADYYHLNFLIVVGGDDVFCEPKFVDNIVEQRKLQNWDFITMTNVPFGTSPFGVSVTGLKKIIKIRKNDNTDGWERYFTDTGLFRTLTIKNDDQSLAYPEIRLDLDYEEDLVLIKAIFSRLYKLGSVIDLKEVLELLCDKEPQLQSINMEAHRKWAQNKKENWPPIQFD